MQRDERPIACSLGPEAIRARRAELLPGLFRLADAAQLLPDGAQLRFSPSSDMLQAIATAIDAERQCCRFLRFVVTVEPDGGPILLTLTGPVGTGSFVEALVNG